jgi:hypothetical protein
MHDALIGLAFWGMILLPCVVAMGTRQHETDDRLDD